jgi:hypothetical protein
MATYRYSRARYRRYSYRRSNDGTKLAVAAVIALAMAGAGGVTAGHAVVTAVRGGSSYTPQTWAVAFLRATGEPATPCNLGFVRAWERAEGGAFVNNATGNPLNDTLIEPGSHPVNAVGVQAYASWGQGLAATVTTLSHYPGILAALSAGNDAQRAADAVAVSPWGTQPFTASCQ